MAIYVYIGGMNIMVAMKRHGRVVFLKYRNLYSATLILHFLLEKGKQSQAGLKPSRQFMGPYMAPSLSYPLPLPSFRNEQVYIPLIQILEELLCFFSSSFLLLCFLPPSLPSFLLKVQLRMYMHKYDSNVTFKVTHL